MTRRYEHDACGVAFVARLGAPASHEVVSRALWALEHLEHRGAEGADPDTGDGAGILIQLPDAFLRAEAGFELPPEGRYGVAVCFLPRDDEARARAVELLEERVAHRGPAAARLARRAGGPRALRRGLRRGGPDHPPALRGRRRRGGGSRRARAQALRDPPLRGEGGRARLRDRRLLVAHARLQGDAHRAPAVALLPRPAPRAAGRRSWRWCTRASPPTPSRAGSWRTPTGCSPTTARSTRCAATATGTAPAS